MGSRHDLGVRLTHCVHSLSIMTYYKHQLSDVFSRYEAACDWYNALGFTYAKTRYGLYKRHFETFASSAVSGKEIPELLEFKKSFDNAYLEANEIIRIHQNLATLNADDFISQIEKVLSGQEFRAHTNNDQARDFLFELSVASRFLHAGHNVSLTGICDVVVDPGSESPLFVECKRAKSIKSLEANVKKANKQIVKRLRTHISNRAKGLIAVNITDLLPKPLRMYPDKLAGSTIIHRGISINFVKNQAEQFYSGQSKKCLGVMCESSMMFYLSENSPQAGLIYSRHTDFLSYTNCNDLELIGAKISSQDIVRPIDISAAQPRLSELAE